MDISSMTETFNEVRMDFGLLPLRFKTVSKIQFIKEVGEDTLGAVAQGMITLNEDYFPDPPSKRTIGGMEFEVVAKEVEESIFTHEFGHPYRQYRAPGAFKDKVKDAKAVSTRFSDIKLLAVNKLLNIVYDWVIDVLSYDRLGYDSRPIHWAMVDEESTKGLSKIGQLLYAFRFEMGLGQYLPINIDADVTEAAQKGNAIIRDPESSFDPSGRNLRLAVIIVELWQKDPSMDLVEAIVIALKGAGIGNADAGTAEDSSEDPLEEKISSLDLDDEEERKIAAELLGMTEEVMAFYALWEMAAERVRLSTPLGAPSQGCAIKAADVPWYPGQPVKDLNIESTIYHNGVFIPGVTSLQDLKVEGPGFPEEGISAPICISGDFSGSIAQGGSPIETDTRGGEYDIALIGVFAMIQEAKRRDVEVMVNLFGDENIVIPWSNDHRQVAYYTFKKVTDAGGGNSVTGLEPVVPAMRPGDLLVYLTDYELCSEARKKRGALELQQILAKGCGIIFIALFNHCAESAGIPYVECKELKDLEEVALRAICQS